MSDFWPSAATWLAHTTLAGGAVLGGGWLISRLLTDPGRRVAVMGWAVRGAVLSAILCALPGWLTLPKPEWAKSEPAPAVRVETVTPAATAYTATCDLTLLEPEKNEQWEWVFAQEPPHSVTNEGALLAFRAPAGDAAPAGCPPPPAPVSEATGSAATAAETGIARLVLIVFGLIAGVGVAQLLAGQVALWRLRRTARPVPDHVRRLFEMFAPAGRPIPALLASDKVAFPVCFGLTRPTILLPYSLVRGADGEVLKWVLAHEMDHLRRGDPWTGFWLAVARACYFFLPWYWAVRKDLRLMQEYLADAAAASAGGNPTEYAAFLVSLTGQPASRRLTRHPLGASGVRAKPSDLFRRVNMLLQSGERSPRTPSKVWSRLTAGGTLGAAVLLSGFGFADDNKTTKSETRTVVLSPDGKAGEHEIELTVVTSDDEPKVEKRKVRIEDGDEPKVLQVQGRVVEVNNRRVEELKSKIADAAKKGDVDAVRKLADELAKAATAQSGRAIVVEGEPRKVERVEAARQEKRPEPPKAPAAPKIATAQAVPATPRTPVTGVLAAQVTQDKLKEAMEKGDAKFKEAMEKVKDNPEAREAMEKAMKEFHKAMEEQMKAAPKAAPGQFQGMQGFQAPQGFKVQPFDGGAFNWVQGPDGKTFTIQGAGKPGETRLGIAIEKPHEVLVEQLDLPKGQGVIVIQVVKDSAAEKAGIKAKDVLLTLNGKPLPSEPGDAIKVIGNLKKDEKVDIVIVRKGQKETIKGISIPEGKKVELRKVEGGKGVDFILPKDAKIPDDVRQEVEKKIRDAQQHAQREMERVQREVPRIQEQAQREVERAMREVPRIQGDLQKEIERLKVELRRMEERVEKGAKGEGTTGKGEGKAKSSQTSMSVQTDGETFTIVAERDGVKYNLTGTLEDGKAVLGKATVKDGDKNVSASSLEKVPGAYRDAVKSMLGSVGGGKK